MKRNRTTPQRQGERPPTQCILFVTLAAALMASPVFGDGSDFEGLTQNQTINLQGGWTVEDSFGNDRNDHGQTPYDEEVIDGGSGNAVWRLSDAVTGGFSTLPMSYTSPWAAGETTAALYNDYGTDHTMPADPPAFGENAGTKHFHASFQFKSKTQAPQQDLSISVSAAAKQTPFRDTYLNIVDDGANGFDLSFYNTGTVADPWGTGGWVSAPAAALDLAYDQWHTIEMFVTVVEGTHGDGHGNDVVNVFVNGNLAFTGTTWETLYRSGIPDAGGFAHVQAVNSLMFRPGTATPANAGQGILFDNVIVDNQPIPEPTSLALIGIGGFALLRRRRG